MPRLTSGLVVQLMRVVSAGVGGVRMEVTSEMSLGHLKTHYLL